MFRRKSRKKSRRKSDDYEKRYQEWKRQNPNAGPNWDKYLSESKSSRDRNYQRLDQQEQHIQECAARNAHLREQLRKLKEQHGTSDPKLIGLKRRYNQMVYDRDTPPSLEELQARFRNLQSFGRRRRSRRKSKRSRRSRRVSRRRRSRRSRRRKKSKRRFSKKWKH